MGANRQVEVVECGSDGMARSMATSDNGTDHAVIALGSDESIAADQYDDFDSVSSVSTFTDLLRRYTFAYEPDYSLKLRKRCDTFADLPAPPPLQMFPATYPEACMYLGGARRSSAQISPSLPSDPSLSSCASPPFGSLILCTTHHCPVIASAPQAAASGSKHGPKI